MAVGGSTYGGNRGDGGVGARVMDWDIFLVVAMIVISRKLKRCVELSNIGAIRTIDQILNGSNLMYQHKFALLPS